MTFTKSRTKQSLHEIPMSSVAVEIILTHCEVYKSINPVSIVLARKT